MRINSINSYNYRSNLSKCTKPCKNNDTPLSGENANSSIREPLKQGLSFGTIADAYALERVSTLGKQVKTYCGYGVDTSALETTKFVDVYTDAEDGDKLKVRINTELADKRGVTEVIERDLDKIKEKYGDDFSSDPNAIYNLVKEVWYYDKNYSNHYLDVYCVLNNKDMKYRTNNAPKDAWFFKFNKYDLENKPKIVSHTLNMEPFGDPKVRKAPSKYGFFKSLIFEYKEAARQEKITLYHETLRKEAAELGLKYPACYERELDVTNPDDFNFILKIRELNKHFFDTFYPDPQEPKPMDITDINLMYDMPQ